MLCTPAASFALEDYDAPQRQDGWTPRGDGWRFDGHTLTRADGAAFSSVTFDLSPDSRFVDRRYVVTDRFGVGGWGVFLPAYRAATGETRARFEDFPAGTVLRIEGRTAALRRDAFTLGDDASPTAYAYVGPRSYVAGGRVAVIAGDETPAWLRQELLDEINHVVARMTARLGRPPNVAPTIFVGYSQEGGHGFNFKGGVIGGNVITFDLRGVRLDQSNHELVDNILNVAAHETVHLWNAAVWRPAEEERQPWLQEGGAEYLASRLWEDSDAMREEAQQRLNNCALRSDPHAMDGSQGPVYGQAPYDCGFLVELVAEAGSVRAGKGDIFSLWRTVFEAAGHEPYTPEAFLREAEARGGEQALTATQILLSRADDPRWNQLAPALSALGIETQMRPAGVNEGRVVRGAALMPILGALCHGSHGFYDDGNPAYITLDTTDHCAAALGGDPRISGVNGVSMMTDPAGAYAVMREACAHGGALTFDQPEGAHLAPIRCTATIGPLPMVFSITALPPLPPP